MHNCKNISARLTISSMVIYYITKIIAIYKFTYKKVSTMHFLFVTFLWTFLGFRAKVTYVSVSVNDNKCAPKML